MPTAQATEVASPVQADRPLHRRADIAVLSVVAILLRLPAYFAERHLTVDDGVFGASAVAMRAGGRPFAEVFSSQGPLFLPLLWLADLVGLRTVDAPRLLAVAAGVALTLAVYVVGRMVGDRTGALLAAGLTTVTASTLWVTGPLAADGPALAFGAVAVALALAYRRAPSLATAIWMGLSVGAALSVKSLLLPVAVPVAVVLLAGPSIRWLLAAAGSAAAFNGLVSLPWGLSKVWEQSYGYHLRAAGQKTPGANLAKVFRTMVDRDLPVLVMVGLALGMLVVTGLRRTRSPAGSARGDAPQDPAPPDRAGPVAHLRRRLPTSDAALIGLWLAATVAVLAAEHPLWRPHVAHLVPPVALLIARYRPPAAAIGAAALAVAPYHVHHTWPVLHPPPFRGSAAGVERILGDLPPGALAMSDDPGLVWRAGHRTPPGLVDASILRIQAGQITGVSLGSAAAQRSVCAVVIWDPQRWGSFRDLPGRLAAAGYTVVLRDRDGHTVYRRTACSPG